MSTLPLHTDHARLFDHNRFVYPVLSRRSAGISIGVNLNPDKICNFDCIYCQVDRRSQSETSFVETEALIDELRYTLDLVASGRIYEMPKFHTVPAHLRRLNDIAFSGDGEPTTYKNFDEIISACAEVKRDTELRIACGEPSRTADCGLRIEEPLPQSAIRNQDGLDHQRQHVPPPACPAWPGDPG
jgi:hypothetical protein